MEKKVSFNNGCTLTQRKVKFRMNVENKSNKFSYVYNEKKIIFFNLFYFMFEGFKL